MTLRLYNTLSRRKEVFEPVDPEHVRLYVCGPTVYDYAHIGNARPVVVFDVLYRLLRSLYPRVTYVRNITDVDDKIIAAAADRGEDIAAVTKRFADAYHADMAALGALEPDIEPRATGHIPQMIAMVERLIEAGHAYASDGHVLFNVPSMAEYGRLSRHNRDELIAGARVEVAPYKKDPADFVLWKPSAPDQPGWDSPWGRGRPGWHLECSAMSETHLGETFDIHGGGQDLIFPHHENEIAQSTCAHGGRTFVKYWMHNGYVTVDGEKMSKSLGNFYTVRQLLDGFENTEMGGEVIRFALLTTHYRQPLDWTESRVRSTIRRLNRAYNVLWQLKDYQRSDDVAAPENFYDALMDDLNFPAAISALDELVTNFQKAQTDQAKVELKSQLLASGELLGIYRSDPREWRKSRLERSSGWMKKGLSEEAAVEKISEILIQEKIDQRASARDQKNFAEADRIRDELAAQGIILEDKPGGTTDWRRS